MNFKSCCLSLLALLMFTGAMAQEKESRNNYGDNIIAFSPLQLMDKGVGIALSYERALDRKNFVSLYVPVSIALNDFDQSTTSKHQTFYFMPGIKFYPTGGKGLIRYGIGPNITYATGSQEIALTEFVNGQYITRITDDHFYKLGMMINNSMNINPTSHLYLCLEFGFGFTYLEGTDSGQQLSQSAFNLVQFGFKAGYRF